jgi:hypothetical protein
MRARHDVLREGQPPTPASGEATMPAVPNTATSPIPAELARALAQAVAGYLRSNIYFTASFKLTDSTDNPWAIAGPYDVPNPPEAEKLPDTYGIFGPFYNTMFGLRVAPPNQGTVTKVTLETTDPTRPTIVLEATDARPLPDTLFLTVEAVSKFAVPYYTVVYTPGMASRMLTTFQEAPLAALIHLPWSESEELIPV